jgi:hypothetical protein
VSAGRRIQLQLDVSWDTDQRRTAGTYSLKRFDARHIRRDEVRQIELQRTSRCAGTQQFGYLRVAQPASETHDASIDFLNDADPAVHNACPGRKTGAINSLRSTPR